MRYIKIYAHIALQRDICGEKNAIPILVRIYFSKDLLVSLVNDVEDVHLYKLRRKITVNFSKLYTHGNTYIATAPMIRLRETVFQRNGIIICYFSESLGYFSSYESIVACCGYMYVVSSIN